MKKTNLLVNDPVLDALDARLAMSAPSVAAIASAGQAQTGQEIMGMMAAMSAGRSSQPIVTTAAQGSSAGPAIAAGVVGLAVGGILGAALAGSSKKESKLAATPSAGGHAPVTMTTFKRRVAEKLAPAVQENPKTSAKETPVASNVSGDEWGKPKGNGHIVSLTRAIFPSKEKAAQILTPEAAEALDKGDLPGVSQILHEKKPALYHEWAARGFIPKVEVNAPAPHSEKPNAAPTPNPAAPAAVAPGPQTTATPPPAPTTPPAMSTMPPAVSTGG